MANVGLAEVTVNVTLGHTYQGAIDGVVGPVDVHDGDTIADPILVRLRDQRGAFVWTPTEGEAGPRKLLFSGWPGQSRNITTRIVDLGVVKNIPSGAAS
jgi:hypothetical protein